VDNNVKQGTSFIFPSDHTTLTREQSNEKSRIGRCLFPLRNALNFLWFMKQLLVFTPRHAPRPKRRPTSADPFVSVARDV
jgi:hypothetical protein